MGQLEKESRLRGRAGVEGEPCGAAEDWGLCAHSGRGDGVRGRPELLRTGGCVYTARGMMGCGPGLSWPAVSSLLRLSVIEARLEGRSQALSLPSGAGWMGAGFQESVGPEFLCERLPSVPVPETRVSGLHLTFRPSPH